MSERDIIKKILIDSWCELEELFKKTPYLCEDDKELKNKYATYNKKGKHISWGSMIRLFGSEEYLRSTLFCIINKKIREHIKTNNKKEKLDKNIIVSVEAKIDSRKKRPDILIWKAKGDCPGLWKNGMNLDSSVADCILAMIELKVTGYNLWKNGKYDHFYKEVMYYMEFKEINEGDCIFFFGCYYEDDPTTTCNILKKHTRGLAYLKKIRNLNINTKFENNTIEAYGFRGKSTNWVLR